MADPIDVHVGNKVRERRMLIGLTQSDLGDRLGMSFQQIQKYEKGKNRVSASVLFRISEILNVPISFFFQDLEDDEPVMTDFHRRETLELFRAFRSIDAKTRLGLFEFMKVLDLEAENDEAPPNQ